MSTSPNLSHHPEAFCNLKRQTANQSSRDDWRQYLPDPATYYGARLQKLGKPNGTGWTSARCPFHEDKTPSFTVNLTHGGYKCMVCGASGDLVNFHKTLTGLDFKAAIRELTGRG